MNHFGTLYHHLRSHRAVEDFTHYLGRCLDNPNNHNPILISMAETLHKDRRSLSIKQIRYAEILISKEEER